jgi:uncharacterized damage-inducible protein DinB
MKRNVSAFSIAAFACMCGVTAQAQQAQRQPPTPAQSIRAALAYVNGKVLEMAQDFPEDKYSFAPNKDVRTFGAVIVHVMAGNEFGARSGRGESVKWDDLEKDVKTFKGKAEIVAAFKKWSDEANATLKGIPDDRFKETLSPWVSIIEHAGEHYGQLVVYYRLNGLVPPESRPKSK